jgi:hypothetical protein
VGDYQPHYFPGDTIPLVLTGTVTGGQLVGAAGAVCGANDTTCIGVADRDGVSGDQINVVHRRRADAGRIRLDRRRRPGQVRRRRQGVVLTAGTDAYDRLVGKALTAATDGNPVDVLFP